MEANRPKVGIGVWVFKSGKLLLGKRKNTGRADGEYTSPGGHLEFGETFEECAAREVREEAGIEIEHIKVLSLINFLVFLPEHHYVDILMRADWKSGELENREPEKCEGWNWYELDHLPQPMLKNTPAYLHGLKTGEVYFGTIR
jgi:8-oxo-dGTP diphosphatase